MILGITCDIDWESRLDKVLDSIIDAGYKHYFEKRNYGSSLNEMFVVAMCRNPEYNFKQRIRLSKKEKVLYLDLMFDLNQFKVIEQNEREKIFATKFVTEIPPIVAKYKFDDFDLPQFEADLKKFLNKLKWL